MTGRSTMAVALVGIAILVALALGVRARGMYVRESELSARLEALEGAELSLAPAVLAIRSGTLHDYDDLAPVLRALRKIRALAEEAPELRRAVPRIVEQEQQIELFKTNVALFRVSALALPSAIERVTADGDGSVLSSLRAAVLRYVALPDRDQAEKLRTLALSLDPSRTAPGSDSDDSRIVLAGHVRSLVDHGERVQELTKSVLRPDVRSAIADALEAHEARSLRALVVTVASSGTLGFLVLLLIGLGAEILLLRRKR